MRFTFYLLLILLVIIRIIVTKPSYNNGDRVRISSWILEEPIRYKTSQGLNVAGLKIYLPLYPEVGYGDRIKVEGVVRDGRLINPKLISIEEGDGILFKLRQKIISFYRTCLPEPHASLIAGVTLGSKSQIPESFWESLKNSGVAHVVVASGMNITFVAGFMISLLTVYLTRKKALIFTILGIWIYAIFCGLEAPVIRAGVMTTLAFWAQVKGRVTFSWSVLLLTALLMLIYNPSWIGDTGFILTFVATAGIMLFQGRLDKLLFKVPEIIRKDLSTTMAAQIGVAPIIFATFGKFNILSPLINVLVLWTIPIIMILGVVGGLMGLIIPILGKLILLLAYPLTWWFTFVVNLF